MQNLLLISIVLAFISCNIFAEQKPKLPDYALPVLQNWLTYNTDVVEACVFKEEWRSPTENSPKGVLLKYATITRVHKGSVTVGEKIILTYLVEYGRDEWRREAKLHPNRVSIGDGSLMISMFSKEESPIKDGFRRVGDGICRFSFDSEFYKAFLIEKKRDPELIGIPN